MKCVWDIPEEKRHCEYCLAYCEERIMPPDSTYVQNVIMPQTIIEGKDYYIIDGKYIEKTI